MANYVGALVQWLRDNLGLISSAPEIETLAQTVADNGGAYFVPAFSGLFAPYWRSDARGAIVGLTRYVNKGHLARAVLEASAYQTCDIVNAMNKDSGVHLSRLKVDGGRPIPPVWPWGSGRGSMSCEKTGPRTRPGSQP
jgi:glycerol kinase